MKPSEFSWPIESSSSLNEATDRFLGELKEWIYACIETYGGQAPTDIHDQLTYTTGWEPYILATGDQVVMDFLNQARDDVTAHFTTTNQWWHGYWRMQEAHHGTEHFELFLGMMSRLSPDAPTTTHQLVDAAEHIGNWSPDVPEWYDESTGLFRSLYFGTDGVREDTHQLNMPDHLRCANILMLVYDATRETKYLDLATTYAGRWADAVSNLDSPIPLGFTREGAVTTLTGEGEAVYRSVAGMAGDLDSELERAENILASGGIQLFLKLWQCTKEDRFLNAAMRLLTILSSQLQDPDAGAVADVIRIYRRVTGRHDFDPFILDAVASLDPFNVAEIELSLPPPLHKRPAGIGKRSDMPVWLEDGVPRRHNPILLAAAAEIMDDSRLAVRALDLGRAYFSLAGKHFKDGRHHGCAARTVSAVARGHGRDNHAGVTTTVLQPVLTC